MDALNRQIINRLQTGFPISARPFHDVALELDITEETLIERLDTLLKSNTLTRFGPLYHAEKLGGGLLLAAMSIPEAEFDQVAETVNEFPQVAHNYARDHELNMWFVLATETETEIDQTVAAIEAKTGYTVYSFPKQNEFYVGLYLQS